jgi:transcriptional regulator with XRE-family HTH domain
MTKSTESIANQRFRKVYDTLIQNKKIKNKQELAEQLDTYSHIITLYLKGERNITLEQLSKLCNLYDIDANYFFGKSDVALIDGIVPTQVANADEDGRNNITLVPQKAMAGYAMRPGDWNFLDSLQKFSIPGLEGNLTAFEISGDSMLPTITNGDIVVCEPIERDEPIRDNQVYIIVTDVVVAKRIQQIKQGNKTMRLRLISDNGEVYLPYEVDSNEVQQILRVKCRLTNHAFA